MDSLSISASVPTLLQLTGSIGWELKRFHHDSRDVNDKLKNLRQDVEWFDDVLHEMNHAFDKVAASTTGVSGNLWRHIARSLGDGAGVLQGLHKKLEDIDKDTKLLSNTRKQLRLNMGQAEVDAYRDQITWFKDCLSLSMMTMIMHNQASGNSTSDLATLQTEIRRAAVELNEKIAQLQQSLDNRPALTIYSHLRDCVQSSADVVTSTTSSGTIRDNVGMTPGSDFGDLFPAVNSLPMQRWLKNTLENEEWVFSAARRNEYPNRASSTHLQQAVAEMH